MAGRRCGDDPASQGEQDQDDGSAQDAAVTGGLHEGTSLAAGREAGRGAPQRPTPDRRPRRTMGGALGPRSGAPARRLAPIGADEDTDERRRPTVAGQRRCPTGFPRPRVSSGRTLPRSAENSQIGDRRLVTDPRVTQDAHRGGRFGSLRQVCRDGRPGIDLVTYRDASAERSRLVSEGAAARSETRHGCRRRKGYSVTRFRGLWAVPPRHAGRPHAERMVRQ